MSGGKRSKGCSERYEAKLRARMAVRLFPFVAEATAWRMKVFEKAVVDLATQVAIVKGLSRNLFICQLTLSLNGHGRTDAAATDKLLYFSSFRGDVYSRVEEASPVSVIFMRAFAPNRSSAIYNMTIGRSFRKGSRMEKRGRSSGAW